MYNARIIDRFLKTVQHIGAEEGCLLTQLPGKVTLGYFNEVKMMLQQVSAAESDWGIAAAFHRSSWYSFETLDLLGEYIARWCCVIFQKQEMMRVTMAQVLFTTAFMVDQIITAVIIALIFLKDKATQIKRRLKGGNDVYACFNNTIGRSYENATTLKRLLE